MDEIYRIINICQLEIFSGIDYYIGTIEENNSEFEDYIGMVPALRFDIGYAL